MDELVHAVTCPTCADHYLEIGLPNLLNNMEFCGEIAPHTLPS
jgi:hypothetical protein